MGLVLGLAAFLWGVGWAMQKPISTRLLMVGGLLVVVIGLHLILPSGHPIRAQTGDGPFVWIFLIAFGLVVKGYSTLLNHLKSQAQNAAPQQSASAQNSQPFTDTELERYARHIVLRDIGGAGQKRLKDASVLVVGAGGLGAPALQYLAAAGVGTIGIIDDDVVDNSNLQRQVIHTDARIGLPKVQSAAQAINDLNSYVTVKPYNRRLTPDIAADLIAEFDIILDGCDNFETRYLVNKICVETKTPLIAAALTQWEGQISLYAPSDGTPCYQCIFPQAPAPELVPSCAEGGVLGPLPGVMGAMMAVETVKALTNAGEGLGGRMLIYDALYAETRTMTLKSRADCPVCGS